MSANWFAFCPKACDPNAAKTSSSSSQFTARTLVGWATPRASATEVVIVKAPNMSDHGFGFPRKKKHPEMAHRTHLFFEEDASPNVGNKTNVGNKANLGSKGDVGFVSERTRSSGKVAETSKLDSSSKNGDALKSSCSMDQIEAENKATQRSTTTSKTDTSKPESSKPESSKPESSKAESLVSLRNSGSEYKMKFRPFSVYEYVDGRFVSDGAPASHPWYEEVLELRREADLYRARGWGTDLVPDHIKELYKQNRHPKSDLDALSLALQPDPRGSANKSRGGAARGAPSPAARGRGMARPSHSRLANQSRSASRPASARPPGAARRAESEEKAKPKRRAESKEKKAKSVSTKEKLNQATKEPELTSANNKLDDGPVDSLASEVTLPAALDTEASVATSCEPRDLVKSPPEPTRVLDDACNVASPEPMNWTVPIDKNNEIDVSVNPVVEAIEEDVEQDEGHEEQCGDKADNVNKVDDDLKADDVDQKKEESNDKQTDLGTEIKSQIDNNAAQLNGEEVEKIKEEMIKDDESNLDTNQALLEKKDDAVAQESRPLPGTTLRLLEDPSQAEVDLHHQTNQQQQEEQQGEEQQDVPVGAVSEPVQVVRPTYHVLEDPFNL